MKDLTRAKGSKEVWFTPIMSKRGLITFVCDLILGFSLGYLYAVHEFNNILYRSATNHELFLTQGYNYSITFAELSFWFPSMFPVP